MEPQGPAVDILAPSDDPLGPPVRWTNWVGNQRFEAAHYAEPGDEDEVARLVGEASRRGVGVRVAGAGHSFTPVVQTDGLLLDLKAMRGVTAVDPAASRATALPSTLISDFYEPLWNAGLALRNQGDIDTQRIAGATATGTHGSGVAQPSLSASVAGLRVVTASGDVIEIDGSRPELLAAAQVSVGMLGVVTAVEMNVSPAYRLQKWVGYLHYDEVRRRFDELLAHRHFSLFWLPTDASAALYLLETPDGESLVDHCQVKLYDDITDGEEPRPGWHAGRSYEIYPMVYDPNFHELEYMLPVEHGLAAMADVRRLMLERFPECIYPMEVRFTGADTAFLSPNYEADTCVISVSGEPGTDYGPFLRAVDETLEPYRARPHWGKLHFATRERVDALYPRAEDFRRLRRELDPQGMFLNDQLRPLFD
jgi:FAD/FMN-containing dehydrogenase